MQTGFRFRTGHAVLLTVLLLVVGTALGGKPRTRVASRADAAKSRHMYYGALRSSLLGDDDAAFEYAGRALALDPDNSEAAMIYGPMLMALRNPAVNDSDGVAGALAGMRRYLDRYPDDVNEGVLYALLAGMRDTLPEAIRALEELRRRHPDNSSVLAYLSQAYANSGNTVSAVAALDDYERVEGKSGALTMQKMSLLLAGGDTLKAMDEVNRLIDSNPRDHTYRILKGNLYEVMERLDSAENMYRLAGSLAPDASEPKIALMEVCRERGDSAAYDSMLYEVLLTDGLDVEEKSKLLAEYLQRVIDDKSDTQHGDYLFSVLRKQYPHEPEVMNLAARYSAAKNDYGAAAEQTQYALDMDPKNPMLWQQLIYYLANAGRTEEALAAYTRADTVTVMTEGMRLYGGVMLQNAGRYGEARTLYRTIIRNAVPDLNTDTVVEVSALPRDITLATLDFVSDALTALGDCEYQLKDTAAAFREYANALTLNPDNVMAANNYAYFLSVSGGDLDRARKLSEQSLRGDNADNPTFLDTYAWILFLQGDIKGALEYEKRAIAVMEEKGTADAEAMEHYGDILLRNDFPAEAVRYWKLALEAGPEREGLKEKISTTEKNLNKQ